MEYKEAADRFIRLLLLNASFAGDAGLLHGKAGIAILFFTLWEQTGSSLYREFAGDLIDQVYEDINDDTPLNFEHGLAGIGWAVEFLAQRGCLEADTNQVLADVDAAIWTHIQSKGGMRWSADDFNTGLYLVKRYEKSKANRSSFGLIARALSAVTGHFEQGLFGPKSLPLHKAVLFLRFLGELGDIPEFAAKAAAAKKAAVPLYEQAMRDPERVKERIVLKAALLQLGAGNCDRHMPHGIENGLSTPGIGHTIGDCLLLAPAFHYLFTLTSHTAFSREAGYWLAKAVQMGGELAGSDRYGVFDPAGKVPLGLCDGLAGIVQCALTVNNPYAPAGTVLYNIV